MLSLKNIRVKHTFRSVIGTGVLTLAVCSCANMGNPTGGPIDVTPPKFVGSIPSIGTLNNTKKKIVLEFDEFIKIENASEKVIVSPPQALSPEIKQNGKKISVNLLDSLKPNSTYTIDFSDAIVDNNEGNPLGSFAFTFSTGTKIDTLEVSGYLLDASNLEPVKGMLVGLHSNLTDSAFIKLPFDRVSRTDSRGHFTIKGVAPGTYRVFGLQDANQNFAFDQKSEAIAVYGSPVTPRFEVRSKQDTIWRDTITVDTILTKRYTHYLPDDLILRTFKEEVKSQYLIKSERLNPNKFSLYFAAASTTLPSIKGINFNEKDAFFVEKALKNDTIHYWVKDSVLIKKDTLEMSLNYLYTDTLGHLVPKTDTLYLAVKKLKGSTVPKRKKGEPEPIKLLQVKNDVPQSMDVYRNIRLEFEEPVADYDKNAIHLQQKVDSLWKEAPFIFRQDTLHPREYELVTEWEPEKEYRFAVDSAAFRSIYGLHSGKIESKFKVRSLDEYATLYFNITGADSTAYVELLDAQDKPVRKVKAVNGKADFYFLNPGKYYVRLINDSNGNGVWDTGNFEKGIQPEEVFYYNQVLELKALWEIEQDWNVRGVSLEKQKPDILKKQKPDEKKKKKTQNSRTNSNSRRGF
ncbi:Ig-like domain-containing protein [Bacteroides sedimenti]